MTDKELAELDLAVAKAEGLAGVIEAFMTNPPSGHFCFLLKDGKPDFTRYPYRPSRASTEAMLLQEKHLLGVQYRDGEWEAGRVVDDYEGLVAIAYGPTPAIAICRAVIKLHGAAVD